MHVHTHSPNVFTRIIFIFIYLFSPLFYFFFSFSSVLISRSRLFAGCSSFVTPKVNFNALAIVMANDDLIITLSLLLLLLLLISFTFLLLFLWIYWRLFHKFSWTCCIYFYISSRAQINLLLLMLVEMRCDFCCCCCCALNCCYVFRCYCWFCACCCLTKTNDIRSIRLHTYTFFCFTICCTLSI